MTVLIDLIRLKLACLNSPSSLVPVRKDGTARLIFLESLLPPIIPLEQCFFFADASRRQLYSKNNYKATAYLAQAIYEEHEDNRAHREDDFSIDMKAQQGQHRKSPSNHNANANNTRPVRKDITGSHSNSNHAGGLGDGASIIPNIVSEEAVTVLAEAAGAVGRYNPTLIFTSLLTYCIVYVCVQHIMIQ